VPSLVDTVMKRQGPIKGRDFTDKVGKTDSDSRITVFYTKSINDVRQTI
jgi:hypothetical protein